MREALVYNDKEVEEGAAKSNSEGFSIELGDLKYIEDVKAFDNTITRIEGNKSYSKILMVQGMITMFAVAFTMYSLGFINSLPKFYCQVGGETMLLPESDACKIIDQCSVEYFYHGWVEKYGMICEKRSSRVFLVSLIFIINASVFFTLQSMADIFGRNMVLKLSTILASTGTFLIYYLDNYGAKIIIFGMVTGTTSVFQMMYTLGLKEAVNSSSEDNVYMNAVLNCAYNVGPTLVALIACFVTSYEHLSLVGFLIVVVGSVGNFFIFNETPLFLYKKKKGKDFINKLFILSKINSVTTSKKSILKHIISDELRYTNRHKLVLPEEGIKQTVIHTDKKYTELKELNNKLSTTIQTDEQTSDNDTPNVIWLSVVLCYWCASLYCVNYGTIISIDKSGMDNLYYNSAILGMSFLFGYAISIKFPRDVKRIKTISIIVVLLLSTSTVILILDTYASSSGMVKIAKSIMTVGMMPILVAMGFSVMYLYLPDVYPITLRGVGIGVVICMGKVVGGVGSAYISNYMNQYSLNPIAGCCIPSVLLLVLLRTVPPA